MNDFKDMHVTTHTLFKGRLVQHVSSVRGIQKTIKATYTSSNKFTSLLNNNQYILPLAHMLK